jgi:uncharacterized protein (TIGR02265 family)
MFPAAVARLAQQSGVPLTKARDRYTPFSPYPLRQHCDLLLEAAKGVFPRLSLREGLRRIGRGAPQVLIQSTIGRVVLGSAEGPAPLLKAMAKSYALHMRPCILDVVEHGDSRAIVRIADVHNFLDCHNVGVFEGVLRYAGVNGRVRIHTYDRTHADLCCEW